MTVAGWARGGWWHDYVCPTHGTELDPPVADRYPCPHGCRWTGEPYGSGWLALEHQRNARQIRSLATAAAAAAGDAAAADRALDWLASYARAYATVPADHEGAREWMVPGRLFQQALSESIWAAGVAIGVWTLREVLDPARTDRLVRDAVPLLTGLHDTAAAARGRTQLRSNYVAWFNAAGALTAGALTRLGAPPPPAGWIDGPAGIHAHARVAVLDDGWEWEGSTYYHAFVLLAYLYGLRGTDPADLPPDVAGRIAGMIDVLGSIATPDGVLPALHDSPYRRPAAAERDGRGGPVHRRIEICELAEVVALAGQLVATRALDGLAGWCREVLAGTDDAGLLDGPAGWFAGPPLPSRGSGRPGSVVFGQAGYAVLRPPDASWLAVLDFGPHGGSHGHLDKLALYLYGDRVAWQPDPGVVPYGSRMRHDVYRTTRAHPTFSVDGAEQAECAGRLLRWTGDPPAAVVAAADHAYPGVFARRHLVVFDGGLPDGGLLDVLELRADRERALAVHLRPAVPVTVRAEAGRWRTDWEGAVPLAGWHACSVASELAVVPGWAPADDPSRPIRWLDWTASAPAAVFATLWLAGHPAGVPVPLSLEVTSQAVTVHRPDGASDRYLLTPGDPS
ncbi:MAG: hypothetical protein GEV12_00760 [Micromonosporaceae bacterium]|nr:hypothetical protein [Micromonosporaceae bacterium]